jgi:hypothetical protein
MTARDRSRALMRRVTFGSAALAAVIGFVLALRGRPEFASPPEASRAASPMSSFRQPEQAERYREAIIQGNTRALAVLDEAIATARKRPGTDRAYLLSLERMRAERAERIQAHSQR